MQLRIPITYVLLVKSSVRVPQDMMRAPVEMQAAISAAMPSSPKGSPFRLVASTRSVCLLPEITDVCLTDGELVSLLAHRNGAAQVLDPGLHEVGGPGVDGFKLHGAVEKHVGDLLDLVVRHVDLGKMPLEIIRRADGYGMRVGLGRAQVGRRHGGILTARFHEGQGRRCSRRGRAGAHCGKTTSMRRLR